MKALAIVRVFETGRAEGDPTAVAVLDDGAGISYGISQFTHRSGALHEVVERYLEFGGAVGRGVLAASLSALRDRSAKSVASAAGNATLKAALRAAGVTSEMREAQMLIARERYLKPAIAACDGSGFREPLSLAVIYDSMTHGSYALIRDRVRVARTAANFERLWITEYVRCRDAWLASIPRLNVTRYRTRFFLMQIALGRWELKLPLTVHGVRLTNESIGILPETRADSGDAAGAANLPEKPTDLPARNLEQPACDPRPLPQTAVNFIRGREALDDVEQKINSAAARYDQVERMAHAVTTRTDRAKSLWTTVAATLWQMGWALFGVLAGLPREVWFFVAGATAVVMLLYLYRQVELGKIRERAVNGGER